MNNERLGQNRGDDRGSQRAAGWALDKRQSISQLDATKVPSVKPSPLRVWCAARLLEVGGHPTHESHVDAAYQPACSGGGSVDVLGSTRSMHSGTS
jgi:hypothetical protein